MANALTGTPKMTVSERIYSTESYRSGFTTRANNLLDQLDFRERGRQSLIARWCKMTPRGVKDMLDNDRCPKEHNFKLFVEKLNEQAVLKSLELSKSEIARYLLHGIYASQTKAKKNDRALTAQIHVTVHQIGIDNGINIFEDLSSNELETVLNMTENYIEQFNVSLDSPAFKDSIRAAIVKVMSVTS